MANIENLKPFKKGRSGNPNGRPKKTIGAINEELEAKGFPEVKKAEVLSCYLRLINTDVSTLKKLIKSNSQPALVVVIGTAILSGKGFDVIEKMLDRGIGKPADVVEISEVRPILTKRIND